MNYSMAIWDSDCLGSRLLSALSKDLLQLHKTFWMGGDGVPGYQFGLICEESLTVVVDDVEFSYPAIYHSQDNQDRSVESSFAVVF